jgi:hypothetical protein
VLADIFKLTEEERKRLNNFPIGQGLFFAGQNHVHIQVVASATEQTLVSTTPQAAPQPTQPIDLTAGAPPQEVDVRSGYLAEGEIK